MISIKMIFGAALIIAGIILLFFRFYLAGAMCIALGIIFVAFRHGEGIIEERQDINK